MAGGVTGQASVGRDWIAALRTDTLGNLYVFYGEEAYRRETALGFIIRRFLPEGKASWDYIELAGRGVTQEDILEAVSSPPVTAERKVVVVKDFDPLKGDAAESFTDIPEDAVVVFMMTEAEWKPDRRTKAYRTLSQAGFFAEFSAASEEELTGFIRRCFLDRGHSIERAECEYLVFLCTNLMGGLLNEIEKISAYAPDTRITRADIDAVATRAVEAKVFAMCDELAAGHIGEALWMLCDLETARESAVGVASVIARQFRQLYAAKLATDEGRGVAYVMELLGIRYRYHADRLVASARAMPAQLLRGALCECMEADTQLKSSRADGYDILRTLIMRYGASAADAEAAWSR